jgi:outer membrane protein assembly factor BamB
MRFSHRIAILSVLALVGCSGGGGGSPLITTPSSPWQKFRHDSLNTGATGVILAKDIASDNVRFFAPPRDASNRPISTSPAIGEDETIYVVTEGGELFAVNQDLTLKWELKDCNGQAFSPIRSSPAVTSVRPGLPTTAANDKIIFFGDDSGHLYAVQDRDAQGPACLWVFPPATDTSTDLSPIVSSPTFTIDPIEEIINGVYFGTTGGVFYGLNGDGSFKWRYPPTGQLGAITSSPALPSGGPLYFTAADGNLYALTLDGTLLFQAVVGSVSDTFASSPAVSARIYVGTDDGRVMALLTNGTPFWTFQTTEPVIASVGIGGTSAPLPPPTATPEITPRPGTPTPTPGPSTPTPTRTPVSLLLRTIIFAVDHGGTVYAIDERNGEPAAGVTVMMPGSASTVSSPAVSADGCIVFGDDAGMLNVVQLQTAPGLTPTPTPSQECATTRVKVTDGAAIRSSPAIDTNGVIYVGADDGRLYAIGTGN